MTEKSTNAGSTMHKTKAAADTSNAYEGTASSRVRKKPQERRKEIVDAAVELIAQNGYNGISLRNVAAKLGMTQQGVLHYVKNKAGLLSLIITEVYDVQGTPEDFRKSGLPGSDNPEGMSLIAYFRYLIRYNSQRRTLVKLYCMLEVEAIQENYPLREYMQSRPQSVWDYYSKFQWKIPPSIGGWGKMRPYVRKALESMDGIQLRWLRTPPIDMYDEWLEFEKMIFPSPIWDDYRI